LLRFCEFVVVPLRREAAGPNKLQQESEEFSQRSSTFDPVGQHDAAQQEEETQMAKVAVAYQSGYGQRGTG